MPAYLNHIGCAVPPHERQREFVESLALWAGPPEMVEKLRRIAGAAGIERRHTVLAQTFGEAGSGAFYRDGAFPTTGERMRVFQREAPGLAIRAVAELERVAGSLRGITHLIVTTCTGFYAPGVDVDLIRACGFSPKVQRTVIGFMGCHAGLIGLRNAKAIVEGDPEAVVLMVNLELCSLHLQQTERLDRLVSFLLFADGCAASLISARPEGLRLDECSSHLSLADAERMAWHIEDSGFAMTLDARLPARIREWFRATEGLSGGGESETRLWAIHPGGRSILDSVQEACGISDAQMGPSRDVLRRYGNMSSASILFTLREVLQGSGHEIEEQAGRAMAFGPGLTVEALDFTLLPRRAGALLRPEEVLASA